ncbi:ATP-binding protein [Halobaculum sp. MBLA0147]|uniref:ATP-binding protein n=1 Tax=Halobaculum sp. MBLA0147 TaxID=3079934 RepID=UPI00352624D0
MSDAHKTFVRESEEGITDLNNALLDLEADPDDPEAMDLIFRTAHTLKGNAAAMGFEQFSELAHAMEDLLDEVRDGEIEVTTELMDLLFEAVDILDAMLGEIDETGDTTSEPDGLEDRLRAIAEGEAELGDGGGSGGSSGDAGTDAAGGADADEAADADATAAGDADGATADAGDDESDAEADGVDVTVAEGDHDHGLEPADDEGVYLASVGVGDTDMPGVDAMFVLEGVEEAFPAMETRLDRDAVEDGEFDDTFDIYLRDEDAETVQAGLEAVSQIEELAVAVLEPSPADDTGTDATEDGDESTDTASDETGAESDDGDESDADTSSGSSGSSSGGSSTSSTSSSSDSISSIRVDVEQLDDLYGLVEQLVTSRIKLRREMEEAGIDSENLDELDKISSNLQNTVMDMRLIPLSSVVDTFPRLVRDLARDQDKQVDFEIEGRDIELDRTILTEIRDPLVHILRNAVDHGIEPPEERVAAGKPETGTIELTATRERDHVNIVVEDDGAGIDADALREKAVDEGVKTEAEVEAMADSEARELIFHPGFSTNEEVTDVSGRGVGMDVVRTTVKELDGSVSLESTPGEGSRFEIRLPVTVAIVRVMFVEVNGTEYGVPIKNIAEVSRAGDVDVVNGDEVVRHDGDIYPVIRLGEVLQADAGTASPTPAAADGGDPDAGPPTDDTELSALGGGTAGGDGPESGDGTAGTDAGAGDDGFELGDEGDDGMLVRIREEKRPVALHCDEVLHQEEVVVKPLEGILSGIPGLSGTAVLGDGDVVTILDVETLGESY